MHPRLPAAAAVLVVAACTFPEVTYSSLAPPVDASSSDGSSGGVEAPMGSEGGDEDSRTDATVDVTTREASGAGDAPPPPADAHDEFVFEASADAPACDQDQDGYAAIAGMCGGGDCDDMDPRAYPGEPNYLTALPRATTMFGDWNCNHVVEKQFPINVTCNALAIGCSSMSGFTGDPDCGTAGTFVQCVATNWGLCGMGPSSTQVQACK